MAIPSPEFMAFAIIFWIFFIVIVVVPHPILIIKWICNPTARKILGDALSYGSITQKQAYPIGTVFEVKSPQYRTLIKATLTIEGKMTYTQTSDPDSNAKKINNRTLKIIFERVLTLSQTNNHKNKILNDTSAKYD